MPFAKITIADICGKCGMNRKSFYYHFRDKYDLVNWIYDTEYLAVVTKKAERTGWDSILHACEYFYENRRFYRKVLLLREQNSFSEHFREIMRPVLEEDLKEILTERKQFELMDDPIAINFYVTFFVDAFLCALERWLTNRECIPPQRFVKLLQDCGRLLL